jgi:peptide chain release factor 2
MTMNHHVFRRLFLIERRYIHNKNSLSRFLRMSSIYLPNFTSKSGLFGSKNQFLLAQKSIPCGPYFSTSTIANEVVSFSTIAEKISKELEHIEKNLLTKENQAKLSSLKAQTMASHFWDDPKKASKVMQTLALMENQMNQFKEIQLTYKNTMELHEMASKEEEEDQEELLQECTHTLQALCRQIDNFQIGLLLKAPGDEMSCFLEIQAGAGGKESCDWVAMLLRMYTRWANHPTRNYQVSTMDHSIGDEVGFRTVMIKIEGAFVYGWLKHEAGVHRLVRISPFDSNAKRHTSFAQVRVYPVSPPQDTLGFDSKLNPKDLRFDTYRSSGAGGQHVNTTDSAVRIVHLPTGIVVTCQSDRSQHRNKAQALEMLHAKLYQRQLEQDQLKRRQLHQQLGENTWGNQIRSYILHPYQMVKDHRSQYQTPQALSLLEGKKEIMDPLLEACLFYFSSKNSLRYNSNVPKDN